MPSAPPTSRVVSLTADPTPALLGGSEETMASEPAGIRVAIPAARKIIASATTGYDVSRPTVARIANPMAWTVKPAVMAPRFPMASTSFGLRGATTIIVMTNGNIRTPASIGEWPRPNWKY